MACQCLGQYRSSLCENVSHERDAEFNEKRHFALFCMNYILGSIHAVLASAQLSSGSQREY